MPRNDARITATMDTKDPWDFSNTESWMEEGNCTSLDPYSVDEIFFVEKGGNSKVAKEFCRFCPVRLPCSQYAINQPADIDGYWGGTTKTERRRLRRMLNIFSEPEEELVIEVSAITSTSINNDGTLGEVITEDHFRGLWPDY